LTARGDGRLDLVIDRTHRANALTPELNKALANEIEGVRNTPDIRVITIRGAGDRVFCSGFDLDLVGNVSDTGLPALMSAVSTSIVPVIGVLNGHAVGAGLELASRCDLRIAVQGCQIGIPAVRKGIAYRVDGLMSILAAAPGLRLALLTGEKVGVESIPGFAEVIAPRGEVDEVASSIINQIMSGGPAAIGYTTRVLRAFKSNALTEVLIKAFDQERITLMAGPEVNASVAARREDDSEKNHPN
jgi:enoyl-CoA hydratase/carnithine racemase